MVQVVRYIEYDSKHIDKDGERIKERNVRVSRMYVDSKG
jgi:hypothetical protein